MLSLQAQASIPFKRGSGGTASIHLGSLGKFPHHLFMGEKSMLKKSHSSQSMSGYICDDLVQELWFVIVMCGQPDSSVYKNKNT